MDEQPQINVQEVVETMSKAFVAIGEAMQQIAVAFVSAFGEAMQKAQDAYHYQQATGMPYDPSKIVQSSLASDVLLLPEHAESLTHRDE